MKKILRTLIIKISSLPVNKIYSLRKLAVLLFAILFGIPMLIWVITNTTTSKIVCYIFTVLSLTLFAFMSTFINTSLQNLLYEQVDLDKWLSFAEYVYKIKKTKNYLALYCLSLSMADYYKGNFQKSIKDGYMVNLPVVANNKLMSDFLTNAYLYKSYLLVGEYTHLEELRIKMTAIQFKSINKINWASNQLKFYQIIEDIIVRKTPNDNINDWQPQAPGGKLATLEKTYFQALNEQLKGNDDKTKELFEQLSHENPDLFFVKEAKKYLETGQNNA